MSLNPQDPAPSPSREAPTEAPTNHNNSCGQALDRKSDITDLCKWFFLAITSGNRTKEQAHASELELKDMKFHNERQDRNPLNP